jgi:hypothetical protein
MAYEHGPSEPKKVGRPTDYTPELVTKICTLIAVGDSLRKICEADDMPSTVTVWTWLNKHEEFLKQYVRAREEAKWSMFDMMQDIAQDGTNDWMQDQYMKGKTPGWAVNGEAVQRSKLRIDTIKWQLSKLAPKEYADKIDVVTNGKDLPVPIISLPKTDD